MTMTVELSVYNWDFNNKIRVSDLMTMLDNANAELFNRTNSDQITDDSTIENNLIFYKHLLGLEKFVQQLALRKFNDNQNLWLVHHDTMINILPCLVLDVSEYNKYYLILKSDS